MNDYKTLCVISEWIDGELTEALKVSDQTHKVNRHIIAFLKRKQREIDKTITHYEKVINKADLIFILVSHKEFKSIKSDNKKIYNFSN